MSRTRAALLGLALLLGGCAHSGATMTHLARTTNYVCKHCNCFIPAGVDENGMCPVCKCGYPAHACRRGR